MIDHYNAFISYRHAPLDIKVAEHIHSKLEHFHIPAKIRKKTGMKRIQRIFRDKDELPITSDLSDTISHALMHSDFLIVICSKSTCESEWVKREIECFLQTHSRDHILAVLAEGEPYEVLPEQLLKEEVKILNPDGTTSTYMHEKEPLCCEYRQSFRKADKDELPRLAAALIGCSYDELMNRRRAYQMQRITALGLTLTALAVGFSGFLIWSRMKIQKNYRDSLRNQSKYLAYESEKLLSEEKRIEAIQLALAALPTDDNDRPVTSEAIRALTDSTLAYQPLSGNTIQSVWNYQTSTRIERMALSPERTSFTVSESTQTVTTWDTKTHEVIFEKAFSGKTVFALNYIGDEDLLVTTDKTVYMIDLNKSKVTWEYSLPDLSNFNTYGPLFPEDMSSIYLPSSGRIIFHFSMDGQLMEQYELPLMIDDKVATFSNYALSPDGNKIAFHLNSDSNYIGVFTFADKSIQRTEIAGPDVRELIWADNETVVFVEFDYLSSENLLRDTNIIVQPHTDIVSCVDTSTMTRKWSKEFKYNVNYSFSELLNLPARNAVAYETGDGIVVYSVETGEELGLYMIQQVVVDIDDSDGDGSFIFVTQSGGLGSPLDSISTNTTTISYEFVDKIRQVLIGDGVYVLQDGGSEVLYYDLYVSDSEWTEIDEDVVLSSLYEFYTDDDYLVISSIDSEKKTSRILAYDANDTELLFDIMLPSDGYSGSRILGIYKDKLYVLDHDPDFQVILYEISMKNGELENETILGSSYISLSDYCSMTDNYLTHYVRSDYSSDFQICLLDLKTGKEELFDMPESDLFPRSAPKYYPEYKVIHFSTETEDYMLDVTDESYIDFDVPGDWSMTFVVEHDSKGERWILSDKSRVIVFNSEGRQEMQLECNGLSAIGATFLREGKSDEQILVVFDDGSLYRYDAKDGSFLGKSEVETYYNSMVRAKFRVFEDQNLIYIQTGEITDIVDMNEWIELGVVWNSMGYHAPTDRFLSFSFKSMKEIRVGYFRHYTLSDLTEKAYRIIGDLELTEEQKSQYGIS